MNTRDGSRRIIGELINGFVRMTRTKWQASQIMILRSAAIA
jgi:hypothetical protein